jgi:hypothetical protein
MDTEVLYIEESILKSLESLLIGRVNELFGDIPCAVPPFELGGVLPYSVNSCVALTSCERSEKERIVLLDAYAVTLSFDVLEQDDTQLCYAYTFAFEKALAEDCTLGGVVDRAVVIKKTYTDLRVDLTLRCTVEGAL